MTVYSRQAPIVDPKERDHRVSTPLRTSRVEYAFLDNLGGPE